MFDSIRFINNLKSLFSDLKNIYLYTVYINMSRTIIILTRIYI